MQNTFPARVAESISGEAGKFIPAFIVSNLGRRRPSRPDHLRHRIRKLPEPGLALHQLRPNALALGNVAGDLGSTDDAPSRFFTGEMVSEMSSSEPSFRRRIVSK